MYVDYIYMRIWVVCFFVELCFALQVYVSFFFFKVLRWYLRRYWCLWWCQSWWIRCWDNARWDVFSTISKKNMCQLFCVPKKICEQWKESWLFRVFGDEILPSCIRIRINRSKDLYQSTRIQRKESGRVLFFPRGSAVVLQTLMVFFRLSATQWFRKVIGFDYVGARDETFPGGVDWWLDDWFLSRGGWRDLGDCCMPLELRLMIWWHFLLKDQKLEKNHKWGQWTTPCCLAPKLFFCF